MNSHPSGLSTLWRMLGATAFLSTAVWLMEDELFIVRMGAMVAVFLGVSLVVDAAVSVVSRALSYHQQENADRRQREMRARERLGWDQEPAEKPFTLYENTDFQASPASVEDEKKVTWSPEDGTRVDGRHVPPPPGYVVEEDQE